MKTCCLWSRTVVCASLLACALALSLPHRLSAQEPRLTNLSALAQAGTGANVLTVGFVIGPGPAKRVLIRAIGPTLGNAPFRLTGVLADPQLTLVNTATGATVSTNDNWVSTDAATMAGVGAFALPTGSKDSAIVTTLASGGYTAQVTGPNNTTGIALVELYELDNTSAKLVNLSTRLQVSPSFSPIIGFVVSPGSGSRRFLARAAGPGLAQFGVTGTLADPSLTLTRTSGIAGTVATNNDWGTPVDSTATPGASLAAAFTQYGAFAFPTGSKDAALLTDIVTGTSPGNYGLQVTGAAGTSGVAIVEVYDTTPATPTTVTIAATKANADETGSNPGEYTITRSGGDTLAPLVVNYGVGGTAVNGVDYLFLPGSIMIPAGASSVKLPLLPNPDLQVDPNDTVIVSIGNGNYLVGAQNSATVTIADSPATLYLATINPTTTATGGTTASGVATILLSASGTVAAVNVSFSNLSSSEVSAHFTFGNSDDFVFNVGPGQVSGAQWYFLPQGTYSSADLLNALKSGNISVRIDTSKFPGGELRGTFGLVTGSVNFTAPAAPPAIALDNVTAVDAARFLTQATFGPTKAEIDALTGQSIDAWITTQIAKPGTSHRTAIQNDRNTFGGSNSYTNWNAIHPPNRQSAWFKTVITADDQLRQRVAFALSEILVVSDQALGDDSKAEPLANYYDLLVNGAFGNFRTLLEQVTLSPMMGEYLSSLHNSKADPTTGQTPDENYAREVMQLFTIGLNYLQPDGTLKLGADALPIPTYNQTTITEMAKVFTGWGYFGATSIRGNGNSLQYINPMIQFATSHETTSKNISPVSSTLIPANQTGQQDLTTALDALYNHQNNAPFIAKQLIQRLITSNPSPAYVYRVAQVFTAQKSSSTQLGAVVRAILTDYEARSPSVTSNQSYGKLKEPLLRLVGVLRSFNASSQSGRFLGYRNTLVDGTPITGTTPLPATTDRLPNTSGSPTINSSTLTYNALGSMAQAALRAPTVFNFYHPDYVLPGDLAKAGLVVPEFEITDDNFAINVPNYLRPFVIATVPNTTAGPYTITLNTTFEQTLSSNPSALLDHLNLVLCAGNMSAATKTRITTAINASTLATDRINTAILLTLTSPASSIQK